MNPDLFEAYAGDRSRFGGPPPGSHSGAAGGAACGDLVRISLCCEGGVVAKVTIAAEGCLAAHACAAAAAELAEGRTILDLARVGSADIVSELGGLSPQAHHAAGLAADALHRAVTALIASEGALVPAEGSGGLVLVAMSGGVDSAVAALLERDAGNEVVAVTLKLWADQHNDGAKSCCSPEAVLGARGLAHSLGLPHLTMDLEDDFRTEIVDEFLSGYASGRTPNPCVRCNGRLRLDAMLDLAERIGAAGLATGHYARIVDDGSGPLLARASDDNKDQTYMLTALRPGSLARMRFPLGELTKPEVREIAAAAGLPVANRAESQDLCFLAGEGRRGFLARHGGLRDREGPISDRSGRVIGRHRGHHNFTVGQRRGIGIAASEPLYVLETDSESNRVVVGTREQLAVHTVELRQATLLRGAGEVDSVKLRYRSKQLRCAVEPHEAAPGFHELLTIRLEEPASGVAPGQVASLMRGDQVVGHATISRGV